MKYHSHSWIRFFFVLFVFLIPVCFSDWIYLSKTATVEAGTKDSDMVTVSVHTRQQSNEETVTTDDQYANATMVPNTDRTETESTFSPKSVGYVTKEKTEISSITTTSSDGTKITITRTYREEKIHAVSKKKWIEYTYSIAYFEWKVIITKTKAAPVDNQVLKLKVKAGETISPIDFSIPNYQQYGFYTDTTYKTLFDFSKPIAMNTDIYMKYYQGNSALTEYINSKTSGTYSIYDSFRGSTGGNYDVFSDFTYENTSFFDYLNQATISSSVTINFVYQDNQVCPSPNTGGIADDDGADHRDSNSNIALDYYGNKYIGNDKCSLMIRLNGDLTVKGTLNIGAKVGGVNSNSHFSEIIGNYTQLDLNGHNLIIDGGIVNCYGSIVDRTGGGKIITENSGTIMGLLQVSDGKGGNQMTYGYSKGQSPFNEYRLAYIEVPIIAMYGTTIKAYLKLDLGSLGISNIYANIIGTKDSCVFYWGEKRTDNDCFEVIPYINSKLYPTNIKTDNYSQYRNMYYYRYKLNMKANVILNSKIPLSAQVRVPIIGKVDVDIDWARIGVPIPPFFDIKVFDKYMLSLKAKMILLPGSSFVTEKGSELNFNAGEIVTYKDVEISDPVNAVVDVVIKGETKRNCGSLMAYDRDFLTYNGGKSHRDYTGGALGNSTFCSYIKPASHMILGKVTIDKMPDSNYQYLISGPISFSKESISSIIGDSNIKTYDINGEQIGSVWFNKSNLKYTASVNIISNFNVLPLISNGKAYIHDSHRNIVGTFDQKTRLTTATDGKKYALWTPGDFLQGGSAPKNQNSLTDYTVTPKEVTGTIENQIIQIENVYYVNYKGVFVPVLDTLDTSTTYSTLNANIRKFCSNNDTALNANSKQFDNVKLSFNTSLKQWDFENFN